MSNLRRLLLVLSMSSSLFVPTAAWAGGIVPIGPVCRNEFRKLRQHGGRWRDADSDRLRGLATIQNLTSGGALKVERSSSLDGVLEVPRSAPWMVGQLGIAEWTFATPVSQFGGYFANNSRFPDAVVDFYNHLGLADRRA